MPERQPIIVTNTTPIISLALIGQLTLLHRLYDKVVIPPAARNEILAGGVSGIGITELEKSDWLITTVLKDARRADLLSDLDRGEAEAIVLAQELGADLVIIDERLARKHARRLGLKLTGTLGILLEAKKRGYISTIKPLVEKLVHGGIRLGDDVIKESLRLAGEK